MTTPDRYRRAVELLQAALERDAGVRASWVEAQCGEDDDLRREVETLLEAHELAGAFLESGPGFLQGEVPHPLAAGARVGAYVLTRELGRGGMGCVFLAERADDEFRHRVAIKVMGARLSRPALLDRFLQERQILAGLEHPNVARLLDGGTTEDGEPYVVLEYVEGLPLDQWCDRQRLDTRARLHLFLDVCAAVEYAHRRLVVHRDLKARNILVTAAGVPKLLDFGIAKLVDPGSRAAGTTETEFRFLTPECASPEQVRGWPVTTASDVYALGVLLYRLLCGRGPYQVASRDAHALARAICDDDPMPPSLALDLPAAGGDEEWIAPDIVAGARDSSVGTLRRQLAGDLDAIVSMAMRKDPAERYGSVEQLAHDLRRHLDGRPVGAVRGSRRYRAAKFARRHRGALAAAVAFVLVLVAGLATTSWEARRAERERARAARHFADVRHLANVFLFDVHDAISDVPGTTKARELLVSTALTYLDSLARDGGDDALTRELATAYERVGDVQGGFRASSLGRTADATASYRKALALRESLARSGSIEDRQALASTYGALAGLGRASGAGEESRRHYHQQLALLETLATEHPEDLALQQRLQGALAKAGDGFLEAGELETAEALQLRACAIAERLYAADPRSYRAALRGCRYSLGLVHMVARNWPAARQSLERAIALAREAVAEEPGSLKGRAEVAGLQESLAQTLLQGGDPPAAVRVFRDSAESYEVLVRRDPDDRRLQLEMAAVLAGLGDALTRASQSRAALEPLDRADRLFGALLAEDIANAELKYRAGYALEVRGRALLAEGDAEGATSALRRAIEQWKTVAAADLQNADVRLELAAAWRTLAEALILSAERTAPAFRRPRWDEAAAGLEVATTLLDGLRSRRASLPLVEALVPEVQEWTARVSALRASHEARF